MRKLTDEEWGVMKEHPEHGAAVLKRYPDFARGVEVVRHHLLTEFLDIAWSVQADGPEDDVSQSQQVRRFTMVRIDGDADAGIQIEVLPRNGKWPRVRLHRPDTAG